MVHAPARHSPVVGVTNGPLTTAEMIGSLMSSAPPPLDMSHANHFRQDPVTARSFSPSSPFGGLQVRAGFSPLPSRHNNGPVRRKLGSPYISTSPQVASSSAAAERHFATTNTWAPQNQGSNPGFGTHHEWQQPNSDSISSPSSHSLYSGSNASINPYAAPYHTTAPSAYYSPAYASPGTLGVPYPIGLHIPMQGSQNYPSPHSAASERASSLCPVTMSENTSPHIPREPSPSDERGPPRRRDNNNNKQQNDEPPKNAQGQIYCNHRDYVGRNETFARKCEWR